MGTQATGTTGSTSSTRQGWALLGAVLVAAFAGILHLGGADTAEVVATMLFAVVFGAALLGGRTAGFAAAAVATLVYAWLRRDSVDDAGMMRLGVVVLGRAASYVVLAYVADLMGDRLPPLPFGGASARGEAEGEGAALQPLELEPGPVEMEPLASEGGEAAYGWEPAPVGPWEPEPVPSEAAWQPPAPEPGVVGANGHHDAPYDPYQPVGADGSPPEGPEYGSWSPAAQGWDEGGTDQEWQPSVRGGAQAVPSGWLHDDDYGDEIPVGYTGELFLQDLTGSQGSTRGESDLPDGRSNGDDVPMIDGMPFGQPIEPRQPIDPRPVEPRQPLEPRGRDQVGWRPGASQEQRYTPAQNEQIWTSDDAVARDSWATPPPPSADLPGAAAPQPYYAGREPAVDAAGSTGGDQAGHLDPETRLWTASYFRDRLAAEYEQASVTGAGFSVVMIQIPDTPFRTLSRRREVALLRELGHQFIRAQIIDHLVHLPDGNHHWFAAVLPDIDRGGAHAFERRLRAAIAGYLRNRGLSLEDIQSATLTSPDDDETMSQIWSSLLGEEADQAYY